MNAGLGFKVLKDIVFKTKPQIALDQRRVAHAAGIPLGTVLADTQATAMIANSATGSRK